MMCALFAQVFELPLPDGQLTVLAKVKDKSIADRIVRQTDGKVLLNHANCRRCVTVLSLF